ncbi:ferredoxin reductase [Gellertiella hungarica]|uniref:Ferredoxin-NADP reductase n=1 Tax=Gellertiella hungarica TaxID=1572859 RepID=A0A7W6J9D2_9HYPH|nr:ferredoxin-NADP reductase [Gellertiella hungarica]
MIEHTTPIGWQIGTISEIVQRTPSIKSFFLRLAQPFTHVAGQHVDIRLTAPDGYSAMRSYSIASDPSRSDTIELVIENLQGEVSAYFHEVAVAGDEIELRGPLGGHFLWPEHESGPILLIGAGSGVAPFMSMIRHRRSGALTVPTALLLSARTRNDALFAEELISSEDGDPNFVLALAITREAPWRASDFSRRVDEAMIKDVVGRMPSAPSHVFICGSNGFVNVAADGVLASGLAPSVIKTERYGG